MSFIVYGQRYNKYDPIIDAKTKEVLDDGQPKKIQLGKWEDESVAENFAASVKANVPKRSWNVFIEEVK